MTRTTIDGLIDAKRKLDVAARVLFVLEHTADSLVGQAEREHCVRIVDATRAAFDEHVDALSAEDRWQFVYGLMLAGALSSEE
jgi:hypothetical protein